MTHVAWLLLWKLRHVTAHALPSSGDWMATPFGGVSFVHLGLHTDSADIVLALKTRTGAQGLAQERTVCELPSKAQGARHGCLLAVAGCAAHGPCTGALRGEGLAYHELQCVSRKIKNVAFQYNKRVEQVHSATTRLCHRGKCTRPEETPGHGQPNATPCRATRPT